MWGKRIPSRGNCKCKRPVVRGSAAERAERLVWKRTGMSLRRPSLRSRWRGVVHGLMAHGKEFRVYSDVEGSQRTVPTGEYHELIYI